MIKTSQLQQKIQYEKVKKILRKKSYNLYGLEKISSKELWAVGSQGMILHSTDGGIEWQERQIMDPEQVFASISFSDSSNAWIVGNQGCILHSSDQGQTWKKVTVPEVKDYYLTCVFFLDSSHGWIVGECGTMLITNDGGKSWQFIETDNFFTIFNDVVFKDPKHGWVVGERGLVMKTTDGGLNWQDISLKTENSLVSIYLYGEKTLWVAGLGGLVLNSRDGGTTWEKKVLRYGEEEVNYNVYDIVQQPYGTASLVKSADAGATDLGHDHIFALCRKRMFNSFDSGYSWRPFYMQEELKEMIFKGGWMYDLEYG
jgi:photosystem II stability/assembly factor-like uncharacterized protein